MEFLTVGNSKIKVVLSRGECESRGIKSDGADYDSPDMRRKIRALLDEAKERVGFDIGREKVLVQLYPSGDGGAEIFITKLGAVSKEVAGMLSRSDNVAVISARRAYYIFDSLENLICAVRSIAPFSPEDSAVHLFDSGEYCLSFCEKEGKRTLSPTFRLLEFGRRVKRAAAEQYLTEHAKLLRSGDAIEFFSKL